MKYRDLLLQDAYEYALKQDSVKKVEGDDADYQIFQEMSRYLLNAHADVMLHIKEFLDETTASQNKMLEDAYDDASKKESFVNPELTAEEQERIELQMKNYFEEQEAAIRTKRIEFYIQEQVAKKKAAKEAAENN